MGVRVMENVAAEVESVDEFDALDDLDDIEFSLDEIENKIAPLALA